MSGSSNRRGLIANRQIHQIAPVKIRPRDRALAVSLLRARESVMRHMRPIFGARGVTEQQWRVLRALSVEEPMDKTTLADRAALLMPSLLRILKDMQESGWVSLVRSTENHRLFNAILTKSGKALVDQISVQVAAKNRVLKRAIGEAEVERLLDLLANVEERLQAI